jgi:hypothetical protein
MLYFVQLRIAARHTFRKIRAVDNILLLSSNAEALDAIFNGQERAVWRAWTARGYHLSRRWRPGGDGPGFTPVVGGAPLPTPTNSAGTLIAQGSPSDTPGPSPTPSDTPTQTYTPSNTYTPSSTPTITPTPSATLTPSNTPTITLTPSGAPVPTSTVTVGHADAITDSAAAAARDALRRNAGKSSPEPARRGEPCPVSTPPSPVTTTVSTPTRTRTSPSSEIAASIDGPVLIIGSGTGRLALALAQQGRTVHGIEIEPAMLERAQRKLAEHPDLSERLTFQAGDALEARLDARFALVIIPTTPSCTSSPTRSSLHCCAARAAGCGPGGCSCFDPAQCRRSLRLAGSRCRHSGAHLPRTGDQATW